VRGTSGSARLGSLCSRSVEHIQWHEPILLVESFHPPLCIDDHTDASELRHHLLGELNGEAKECFSKTELASGFIDGEPSDAENGHGVRRGASTGREVTRIQ